MGMYTEFFFAAEVDRVAAEEDATPTTYYIEDGTLYEAEHLVSGLTQTYKAT